MKLRTMLVAASSLALIAVGFTAGPAVAANTCAAPDPLCVPANGVKPPARDVSHDEVYCDSMVGAIKFSVPLQLGGTTANSISIKATIDGCTDTTAGVYDPDTVSTATTEGVVLAPAKISGLLTSANNDCLGLSGLSTSTSGSTTIGWKSVTKVSNPDYNPLGPVDSKINPPLVGAPKIFSDAPGDGIGKAISNLTINQTYGGTYTPAGDVDGTPVAWSGSSSGFAAFQIGGDAAHHNTAAGSVAGAFRGSDSGASSTMDATTGQSESALAVSCFGKGIKQINFGNGQVTVS